ncbi:MAG: response regulator [Caulobacteraceae bacterium]
MLPVAKPCVLVVDDDAALLGALEFALQAEGYRVRSCSSADAALHAGGDAPACLVIDYRLPGMDGMDLAAQLRSQGVVAPLILMTSNPDARCRAKAALGGAVIVEKPLLGDRLLGQIRAPDRRSPSNRNPESANGSAPERGGSGAESSIITMVGAAMEGGRGAT